jgi:hypothetical protein
MMEETIDTIDDRADVEWKFARSRLYMEYIRDGKYQSSAKSVLFSSIMIHRNTDLFRTNIHKCNPRENYACRTN